MNNAVFDLLCYKIKYGQIKMEDLPPDLRTTLVGMYPELSGYLGDEEQVADVTPVEPEEAVEEPIDEPVETEVETVTDPEEQEETNGD